MAKGEATGLADHGAKPLILSYYDASAARELTAWLGPDRKREAQIHADERPEGM